jgi:GNAT superfamily N-acetyltransferase
MVEKLRIEYLADAPDVLPQLKAWFLREWAPYYGPDGPGDAADDLRSSCNRRALPITLIAFRGDELCATGALKAESVETHKHLGPWVAALLVAPKYRRQGIRGQLVDALEELARELGFEQMYYGADVTDRYLDRNGWQPLERVSYLTGEGSIYRKTL